MIRGLETLLAEHPFFKGLEPTYLSFIAGCGANVTFQAGEYIFREGDPADHFYIIRHGRVQREIFAPERGPLPIDTLAAGDVLGWSWLFPPYRRFSDARALELTRAIALDGACLRDKCDEDHHLGYELMRRLAPLAMRRLQATMLQLLDLYGHARAS
jgi:CRP/FNR family cyclic AMP-dependent transcriptional regulator